MNKTKKNPKVRDMKPNKDTKGGGGLKGIAVDSTKGAPLGGGGTNITGHPTSNN
jgi:hypothetical protein